MTGVHVSTSINGDPVEYVCPADESLLDVLRDRVGLTGVKVRAFTSIYTAQN